MIHSVFTRYFRFCTQVHIPYQVTFMIFQFSLLILVNLQKDISKRVEFNQYFVRVMTIISKIDILFMEKGYLLRIILFPTRTRFPFKVHVEKSKTKEIQIISETEEIQCR